MEIATHITTNPAALFSVGTVFGATTAYYLLRNRFKNSYKDPPMAVPFEERYEFPVLDDEYRVVMAIRNDLKMGKGKVAAQCGHASVSAYVKALQEAPDLLQEWMRFGGTKITVKVESEQELLDLVKSAKQHKILASTIRDAGHTQVAPGSRTVVAIGPARKSTLDKISGHLKLY